MAKRRYRRYRRRREDPLEGVLKIIIGLLVLGSWGYASTHLEELALYGAIGAVVFFIGVILYVLLKRRARHDLNLGLISDESILHMLKSLTPLEFEYKVAEMFQRLGFKTEVCGGTNDGGIDIIAYRNGKKYFIQCKKFITQIVTPHDVRDFLGAITNINNPAVKGYFVTTNGFSLMAEQAAQGNPRIELIDGVRLVQYFKKAFGEDTEENFVASEAINGG